MSDTNGKFWLAVMRLTADAEERIRLWNGYLGWKLPTNIKEDKESGYVWPKLIVEPPDGGWPELTKEDKAMLEMQASAHGGHPKFGENYMDFSSCNFSQRIDFSGLTLVESNFSGSEFKNEVTFDQTRFYGVTYFTDTGFNYAHFSKAIFDAPAHFDKSRFIASATFIGVEFTGGASFNSAMFEGQVMFNDSKFEERYFSGGMVDLVLADFRNATFMTRTSFRNVLFGNDDSVYSRRIWPQRRADFTDAHFQSTTDFRGVVFGGAPAFFNTRLHEDTDFSHINWKKAETDNISADYAIRAWERLELMMSELEKPLDRHQFFRLKMRARRRTENWFLRTLNLIFEVTSDYGWGVKRAFFWWFGHWFGMSVLMYLNTLTAAFPADWLKLAKASLGTGFANAHAFLGLATGDGYLAGCREVLEKNNALGFLNAIGTIETFLGPIFLFLLLLTLRNRFRLA